jgi:Trk K+ transport system NAD-binding subunit
MASPDRRLVRFASVILVLAIASALFFALTARLSPLDAFGYAVSLLTGASSAFGIDSDAASGPLKVYTILLSLLGAAIVAIVYALITDAIVRSRLLQTLGARAVPRTIRDHVIVCGLGTIGYRVALGIKARGVPVVVVERNEDTRFGAAARAAGIPVVVGDSRFPAVLEDLGLRTARALVAVTTDDLANLTAALNARSSRPELRVVVRVFDPDFAERVRHGFGIRFTRSVSHLAAPAFAAATIDSEVAASVPVGDRRVVLFARLTIAAGSRAEGLLASAMVAPGQRRLLAIVDPDGRVRWDPPADEVLDAGESVLVAATRAGLSEFIDLAREPH